MGAIRAGVKYKKAQENMSFVAMKGVAKLHCPLDCWPAPFMYSAILGRWTVGGATFGLITLKLS